MGMVAAGQGSQSSLRLVSCSTLLLLPTRGLLASDADLPGARLASADGARMQPRAPVQSRGRALLGSLSLTAPQLSGPAASS